MNVRSIMGSCGHVVFASPLSRRFNNNEFRSDLRPTVESYDVQTLRSFVPIPTRCLIRVSRLFAIRVVCQTFPLPPSHHDHLNTDHLFWYILFMHCTLNQKSWLVPSKQLVSQLEVRLHVNNLPPRPLVNQPQPLVESRSRIVTVPELSLSVRFGMYDIALSFLLISNPSYSQPSLLF